MDTDWKAVEWRIFADIPYIAECKVFKIIGLVLYKFLLAFPVSRFLCHVSGFLIVCVKFVQICHFQVHLCGEEGIRGGLINR
jgi:hypothetical protein